MTTQLSDFFWGTLWIAAGLFILTSPTTILLLLSKDANIRYKAWIGKRLGNSVLNRNVLPDRASRFLESQKVSKIVLCSLGAMLVLLGALMLFEPGLLRILVR